jgi:hypothetical protein
MIHPLAITNGSEVARTGGARSWDSINGLTLRRAAAVD